MPARTSSRLIFLSVPLPPTRHRPGYHGTIVVRDKGIVLDEPSVVAIRHEGGLRRARKPSRPWAARPAMLGKVPATSSYPPATAIADFTVTEQDAQAVHQDGVSARRVPPEIRASSACPVGPQSPSAGHSGESALGAGASEVIDRGADGRGPSAPGYGVGGVCSMVVDIGGAAPPRWRSRSVAWCAGKRKGRRRRQEVKHPSRRRR